MKVDDLPLPGLKLLRLTALQDQRGYFLKNYHQSSFQKNMLPFVFREEYFTSSSANVLRGMHFQIPPFEHFKMVTCILGSVQDVVVDLRVGSPTYLKNFACELSESVASSLIIPPGFAHGFYSRTDKTILQYKVTTEYSPNHDQGISFDSFGFEWPDSSPILSERDRGFVRLENYNSPFRF